MDDNNSLGSDQLKDNPQMESTKVDAKEYLASSISTDLGNTFSNRIDRASDLLISVSLHADTYKTRIINLSISAMEEFKQMALEEDPLWLFHADTKTQVLDSVEYKKRFRPLDASLEEIIRMISIGVSRELPSFDYDNAESPIENGNESALPMKNGTEVPFETEVSRASGIVLVNPINLVNMFMDVDQWSTVCANIVSKATVLGVLSTGEPGNPDGALQVMMAEFHVPSPLVQTREIYFARYCRQLKLNTWAVIDVSLESIFPNPILRCRRRPSGCLIEGTENGLSNVTWVEKNEADNRWIHHIFSHLVTSGFAFGAKRWVTTLETQFDRLAMHMDNKRVLKGGWMGLLKLTERMVRCFNGNFSGYSTEINNPWRPLPIPGAEDILVRTSYNLDDPGTPCGVAISLASSVWLPVPPQNVFQLISCGNYRHQWDILSTGRVTRDILSISTGREPANRASMVLVEPGPSKTTMLYVQESFTDSTGYYIVYAPVDIFAANLILDGGNPEIVEILPSGFVVIPDGRPAMGKEDSSGSLLTITLQIMDEYLSKPEHLPPQSVATVYRLITETFARIEAALVSTDN